MKVYISGKISGLKKEDYTCKFNDAKYYLEKQGYEVISPIENGLPPESEWDVHMKKDIQLMLDCDMIVLLPCWCYSNGAVIERNLAISLGMKVKNLIDVI